MLISNATPQTTHYTVTGGSTGTPITPPQGTILSGSLPPGAEQELKVSGSGPWKITFSPAGGDRVQVVTANAKDCVQLCERSGMLCAEIAVLVPSAEI